MQLTSLTSLLNNNKHHFHPVVKFDATTDKLLSFDFTSGNKELTNDILSDTNRFTTWVNEKLQEVNARYGIGGYKEHRTVYSISKVFDGDKPGEEPRRLHLGTDIWGKPHTAVMAPLDGIVHSFAFNNRFGDYGATIILSHLLNGVSFYTLYGHLSLNSIKNIQEGDRIEKGDVFGEFGIPSENGSWPPHLHFQIISNIGEWKGDYPGVCKFSEKEKWLANSPDPDIILQLNQFTSSV
ncbi:MAG: peptidoglycan DD-metalloendopeptidase family protein [Chitinophagaceae bacterium]|jgi:murein DD-endopeptidase MepM/ murein hydrolase activator NlpD|nr:peptidoglycan DD-metalloendopeptidase family protein [Chitinophagaceae bacterium]MBK8300098.1 peptidoglycan DD-metalloendopeptidase family protein [Chitinophagaceae bacterium]MBK9464141.1 peptidoglycan DD-metalloendopeptidase family protein [Chitinophagaceae bacterium]MBL0067193.1 peptidoglycan DD-metalloendopeptidase family protein [Chitinophagaceae bacterium]MBP6232545.1 peptidoglycan DD-metalloendopeptidase family protein [Chitinophagaceae bacterium]